MRGPKKRVLSGHHFYHCDAGCCGGGCGGGDVDGDDYLWSVGSDEAETAATWQQP